MMMVQYLLDAGERVTIPGVAAPTTEFADTVAPVELRARAGARGDEPDQRPRAPRARDANDYAGEQFMPGSSRSRSRRSRACPTCYGRASARRENPLLAEEYLVREATGEAADATAPGAAGGAL